MGHKNNRIIDETIEQLKSMIAYGQSKHLDKPLGVTFSKIYSISTFNNYKKVCIDFVKYAKSEFHCKTLSQARNYVDDYLKNLIDKGLSPYTIKLHSAGLAKLYQEPTTNFIATPSRERQNITRSRQECIRDKHFSETKNIELVELLKSSGLRRREVENIRGDCLSWENGQAYIFVNNGKGGKERYVPILNNNPIAIAKIMSTPPNEKVFPKVSNACDVHSYRAYYCSQYYNLICRKGNEIPREQRYYPRKDLKHIGPLDSRALKIVSRALGHERINVIPSNYLWNLK